jgi:hypothetical protein
MSKVLIFSHVPLWGVHHAEAIEIACELEAKGKEVFVLSCVGDLLSCPANPYHINHLCRICRNQTDYSKQKNFPSTVTHLKLNLSSKVVMPEIPACASDFENFVYQKVPIGRLVISQLVDDSRDIVVTDALIQHRGKLLARNAIQLFETTKQLMVDLGIAEVYVWNGRRGSDGPVLYAAQSIGCKAVAFISGSTPEKLFSIEALGVHSISATRNAILRKTEEFESASEDAEMDKQAELFYRQRQFGGGLAYGDAWFGSSFQSNQKPFFDSTRKIHVAIFTSSFWEFVGSPERTDMPSEFYNPYTLLERICRDEDILDKCEVIVRWHPNLTTAGKNELRMVKQCIDSTPEVNHILPKSDTDSYELMEEADVILTTGSTMGIEAAFRGKPSVLAGLANYSGLGSVYEPASYPELVALLTGYLEPLPKHGATRYGAWFYSYGNPYRFLAFNKTLKQYERAGNPIEAPLPYSEIPNALIFHFARTVKHPLSTISMMRRQFLLRIGRKS